MNSNWNGEIHFNDIDGSIKFGKELFACLSNSTSTTNHKGNAGNRRGECRLYLHHVRNMLCES